MKETGAIPVLDDSIATPPLHCIYIYAHVVCDKSSATICHTLKVCPNNLVMSRKYPRNNIYYIKSTSYQFNIDIYHQQYESTNAHPLNSAIIMFYWPKTIFLSACLLNTYVRCNLHFSDFIIVNALQKGYCTESKYVR